MLLYKSNCLFSVQLAYSKRFIEIKKTYWQGNWLLAVDI